MGSSLVAILTIPFYLFATGDSAVGFSDIGFLGSACDGSPASSRQQLLDRVQFETALFGGF
jgi:hypothetical protein